MHSRMREQQRSTTKNRRRKPGEGRVVCIPFDGQVPPSQNHPSPPTLISIEATDAAGQCAEWLSDHFWVDLLRAWGQESLAVHFEPTPECLLHPVVVHQVGMLRRVATTWRVVGQCYLSDLAVEGRLSQAAMLPYHEIRILDSVRPGALESAHPLKITDAIGRIRQVQAANNRTTPIIVRTAAPDQHAPQATDRQQVTTILRESAVPIMTT